MNIALRDPREGIDHFSVKKWIGELADIMFTSLFFEDGRCRNLGHNVRTRYEWQFGVLETCNGPRSYIGDIVTFFYWDGKARALINIEIDGREGHSSKIELEKNKLRDVTISEGIILFPDSDKIPCKVKRFRSDLYQKTDSVSMNELVLEELRDVYRDLDILLISKE